jgi:hypothetical protein
MSSPLLGLIDFTYCGQYLKVHNAKENLLEGEGRHLQDHS